MEDILINSIAHELTNVFIGKTNLNCHYEVSVAYSFDTCKFNDLPCECF